MWKKATDRDRELSLEEWKKVVDALSAKGIRSVELFGGDVLLRKNILIPLIQYIKKKNIVVHMPTNCNLLNNKTAKGLVGADIDVLYLSVDGIDSKHDSIRGLEGTFKNVGKAIKYLKKAKGYIFKPEGTARRAPTDRNNILGRHTGLPLPLEVLDTFSSIV